MPCLPNIPAALCINIPLHCVLPLLPGQLVVVATFSTEGQAVHMANDSEFGLAGAVISADESRCKRVAEALQVSMHLSCRKSDWLTSSNHSCDSSEVLVCLQAGFRHQVHCLHT